MVATLGHRTETRIVTDCRILFCERSVWRESGKIAKATTCSTLAHSMAPIDMSIHTPIFILLVNLLRTVFPIPIIITSCIIIITQTVLTVPFLT